MTGLGVVAEDRKRYGEALEWMRQAEAIYRRYPHNRNIEIVREGIRRVEAKLRGG